MESFATSSAPAHLAAFSINAAQLAAKSAHLRYVSDQRPGIARERGVDGFIYRDREGAVINDRDELARINAIAVPPAWIDFGSVQIAMVTSRLWAAMREAASNIAITLAGGAYGTKRSTNIY